MPISLSLPFVRGETGSNLPAGVDATVLAYLEGAEYCVPDVNPTTGVVRSGRHVWLRIVRNKSGFALLPKRLVAPSGSAGVLRSQIQGYARTTAAQGYVVDEYLPAAGVADNDLFYVVIGGPTLVLTDLAGGAANVVNLGDWLVALTAVTSGATTAGRVSSADFTGATAVLAGQINNKIGQAMSAKTTANTNADLLVDIGAW